MKKTYTAPEILFESFAMSTNIAAGCEEKIDTQAAGNCGIEFGDLVIFVSTYTGCNSDDNGKVSVSGDDGNWNGLCYHVPLGENLFNS